MTFLQIPWSICPNLMSVLNVFYMHSQLGVNRFKNESYACEDSKKGQTMHCIQ
mgnify:CR=1 FL=1